MPVLLETLSDVRSHWRAFAMGAAAILPVANTSCQIREVGLTASLWCREFPNETATRRTGAEIPLVPLIGAVTGESPVYWLSWFEEWAAPRSASNRKVRFHSTGLTLFYGTIDRPKLQLLRAEWAGVESTDRSNVDIFQGRGAAHPHWHVDAVVSYLDRIRDQIESSEADAALRRDLVMERVRDFGESDVNADIGPMFTSQTIDLPTARDLSWTSIHLASNAAWANRPRPGQDGPHTTHANGPNELVEIRQWLLSCIRYVQHEVNEN